MLRHSILVSLLVLGAASCGKGESNQMTNDVGNGEPDGATAQDMGSVAEDTGAGEDDTGSEVGEDLGTADSGGGADAGVERLTESEPNSGTPLEDVDALPIGAVMTGNIDVDDVDVFQVDTEPGDVYVATLTPSAGSSLQPHLTVMDDGRGGDAAGGDYVKIMRGYPVEFIAMGDEGYYVIVRDSRNVDGDGFGGADFGYELTVERRDASAATKGSIDFTTTLSGTLSGPGGVDLWSFDGTEGTDVVFDFATSGDLEGRLYVYSTATGSWIMRTVGDSSRLDAPLTASGTMYLVVESIAETATGLSYTVDASSN